MTYFFIHLNINLGLILVPAVKGNDHWIVSGINFIFLKFDS